MDKTPLEPGHLEHLVRDTFSRAGIQDIGADTPAALFVTVSKWDGLLNRVELNALRILIRQLCPMEIAGFEQARHDS